MNRDIFFERLGNLPSEELKMVQLAYWLAKNTHRTQSRDSGERYFEHPRRVALILLRTGIRDGRTLAVALMHDVLEDTFTPQDAILRLFGSEMYRDLERISKQAPAEDAVTGQVSGWVKKADSEYYAGLMNSHKRVRRVKCADRLDNLQDCNDCWPQQRIAKYVGETEKLVLPLAQMTDPDLTALLEAEIARLKPLISDADR